VSIGKITVCPYCNKENDRISNCKGDGDDNPNEGALSMCMTCGEPSIFTKDLELRKVTEEEFKEMYKDEDFKGLYNSVKNLIVLIRKFGDG